MTTCPHCLTPAQHGPACAVLARREALAETVATLWPLAHGALPAAAPLDARLRRALADIADRAARDLYAACDAEILALVPAADRRAVLASRDAQASTYGT